MIRNLLLPCVLLTLVGCQSSPTLLGKKWLRSPTRALASKSESHADPKPLSKQQQADLHLAMAKAAEQRGDQDAAIRNYEKARQLAPITNDAAHRIALLHDRRGQSSEAAKLYEQVLASEPDNHEVHCDYGYSLYLTHRWPESESHLREAIRLKPDFGRARNILAMMLARQGDAETALAEFARAGVPQAEAHANLGLAMILEGKQAEANSYMKIASSLDPSAKMQDRLATYHRALKGLEVQTASSAVRVASHESSQDAEAAILQHLEDRTQQAPKTATAQQPDLR